MHFHLFFSLFFSSVVDPFTGSMAVDTAAGVLCMLSKSQKYAQDLLDAVRGAKHKKSVWYGLCEQLGGNCHIVLALLKNLEKEFRHGNHSQDVTDATEDIIDVLNHALQDGTKLVLECQNASKATLFFRATMLKEKFRKVADRMAQCLQNIPLAAFSSTLSIERDVAKVVQQLEATK